MSRFTMRECDLGSAVPVPRVRRARPCRHLDPVDERTPQALDRKGHRPVDRNSRTPGWTRARAHSESAHDHLR
jgi:hypothetical protein